jgi:hypothetical protein
MTEDNFAGWSLEHWSLQHELLELHFGLWSAFTTEGEIELYIRENQNAYHKGKGIFSRPSRMVFSNFTPRAKVETATSARRDDGILAYRFSLEGDAYVDIEAGAYASARW